MVKRNLFSMRFIATAIVILLGIAHSSQAQYKTALGVRIGGTSGFALKHFYQQNTAVEGILGFFGNGFSITGLVERSAPAFEPRGLNWYYGGGAHLAFYNSRGYYRVYGRDLIYRESSDVGFGINGIIGLEYQMPDNVPVAFSIDFKPFIEIDTDGDAGFAPDLGVGIKFLIR